MSAAPPIAIQEQRAVTGLTQKEAAQRLAQEGHNDIPAAKGRSLGRIVLEVLREPMLALLVAAAIAYLALGSGAEAIILACFATASIVMTVIQELRTERVLDALRDLAAPTALVLREGALQRLPAPEIVRGDLLVLEAGDRVAADCVLIQAADLQVDESLLTGESLPVAKLAPDSTDGQAHAADDQHILFSGTLVTRGTALAEVTAIGTDSQIGRIGRSLSDITVEQPPLRTETARLVRVCALGGVAVSILVTGLYAATRGGWIDALLAGISVAMSMLPEEFPVVLTVFLAMGAWRIGQVGVLTRRASAIETLGSATILCTDKTGTLTENRMVVTEIWPVKGDRISLAPPVSLSEQSATLLKTAAAACPPTPADPMEIAIREASDEHLTRTPPGATLLRTHGLTPELLAMSNVWYDGRALQVAAKGSPEAIATLCRLDKAELATLLALVDELAASGARILGVAQATAPADTEVASQRDYAFSWLGLIALTDPIRPQIPAAVAALRAAGIKIVMVTGDHAATARAIAGQAGLAAGTVLTGSELSNLSDEELANRLHEVAIFSRILPDQKLRIVRAYKQAGEIVGMIGDGVNDAPSLKAAHIGIAMGKRGTDVAREAASIVLLNDDFGAIVEAVALGRRIYDNIRKAMAFIFAVHVPLAGLALLPFALGIPILFGPIQIALIEMIIDPVCALVFEAQAAERNVMRRPPRRADERLFPLKLIAWSVAQGLFVFVIAVFIVILAETAGLGIESLRSLTFFSFVAMILALILANRSFGSSLLQAFAGHNLALRLVVASVILGGTAALLIPPLRAVLGFAPLSLAGLGVVVVAGVFLLVVIELTKRAIHPEGFRGAGRQARLSGG